MTTATKKKGPQINDLTGKKFGLLTVESLTPERHHGGVVFVCRCECGHQIKVTARHLQREKTPILHCGCQGRGRSVSPAPGTMGIGGTTRKTKLAPSNLTALNALYANYRNLAIRRGFIWELSKEKFFMLVTSNCHYCGVEPHQTFVRKPHTIIYNGVDRVDSGIGYTEDNCVPCCGQCNVAKRKSSAADFLAWVDRVYAYQHRA